MRGGNVSDGIDRNLLCMTPHGSQKKATEQAITPRGRHATVAKIADMCSALPDSASVSAGAVGA